MRRDREAATECCGGRYDPTTGLHYRKIDQGLVTFSATNGPEGYVIKCSKASAASTR